MGIAMREGFLALTSDHFDLTPGVAGQSPLAPRRDGGQVRAPDIVLLGALPGTVFGVEVETRTLATHYPGSTFAEVAKLRDNLEIELTGSVYARAIKGSDYDASAAWRQGDIERILRLYQQGRLEFISRQGGGHLLVLHERHLDNLDALWLRLRGAA